MFTNIEAARTITLTFKSSMEIPLFQWSQVSRHPEWKPDIDDGLSDFRSVLIFNFQLIFNK
jgi:hypothetical protein